jgi:HD-GYP domain-containing protein (c-di-GMP phosphodiesterase class II)
MALAGSLVRSGASLLLLSYTTGGGGGNEPLPVLEVDAQSELWTILDRVEAMDADAVVLPEIECALHATISLALTSSRRIGAATIRSQDAAGAVARLVDLGVSRHRLCRDVVAVLAQHRLPCPCPTCGPLRPLSEEDVPLAGWDAASRQELLRSGPRARQRGRGCSSCAGSGYQGWTTVFESLTLTDEVRERIRLVTDLGQLRETLKAHGSGRSLLEAAWREVLRGRAEAKALPCVPGPEVAPFKLSRASLRQVPDPPDLDEDHAHAPPEEEGEAPAILPGAPGSKAGAAGHQLYRDGYGVVEQAMEVLERGSRLDPAPIRKVARMIVQSVERDQELAHIALASRIGEDLVVHQFNVAILSARIASGLSMDRQEVQQLAMAALLHDVGLLAVPGGAKDMYSPTRTVHGDHHGHSRLGEEMILRSLPGFDWLATVVRQVHERISGKGEPDGLRGDDIHPLAKVLGLADTLESLTRPRPGRETLTTYDAIQHLIRDQAGEFDERHVRAMARNVSLFPVGSLVLLNNRSIARVTTINPDNFHRPRVEIVRDPGGRRMRPPTSVDLGDSPFLYITGPLREPLEGAGEESAT